MNWQKLIFFPLAAIFVGHPLHSPQLKERLPQAVLDACKNSRAIELYLRAYAYSTESSRVSAKLLSAAERESQNCLGNIEALKMRMKNLKKRISLGLGSS